MNPQNEELERNGREHRNGGSGLAGFLLGGLLGAGAMLFLAPQSGRQTREELREGTTQLRDRTSGLVKEKAAQLKTRAQQVTEEAREKVTGLRDQSKEVIAEQLDRVSTAAEAGKKAIKGS
jgi:gas vesicle protein